MNRPVLVLGATGRFGRPVIDNLAKRGVRTRTLSRRSDRARETLGDAGEVIEGDVTDAASV